MAGSSSGVARARGGSGDCFGGCVDSNLLALIS